jgi:hypothetical protein
MNRIIGLILFGFLLCSFSTARGGTASTVSGLYFTGVDDNNKVAGAGATDSHWKVTYATTDGGATVNNTYVGNGTAYIVNNGNNDSGWVDKTNAQWIVPPNAASTDTFPGNGTSGANAASFIYTLSFTIVGNVGDNANGSVVTNQTSITLTLAADDQASVYVNPTLNANGSINSSSKLGGSIASAWKNTQTITLQNYDDGTHSNNAVFKIGLNTLVIQVDNTNSQTGDSLSTQLNASGLLVYQTGAATVIGTKPAPEVAVWLPIVGALGLFCWRRSRTSKPKSVA